MGRRTNWRVGKFETGGTTEYPLIKPNIASITSNTIMKEFDTSLKFTGKTFNNESCEIDYTNDNYYNIPKNVDSHMMKNTEWGMVAILSQSRYGKMGNNNYSLGNKEVYMNPNRITGRGYVSTTNTGTYSYNDYKCENNNTGTCTGKKEKNTGTGASSTGSIYGIYDLNGGWWEHTMSNYNRNIGSSGFLNFPEQKYYDLYTIGGDGATKEKAIMGDATWETKRWYNDGYNILPGSRPWGVRGGHPDDGIRAGVFATHNYDGNGVGDTSFRVVLIP